MRGRVCNDSGHYRLQKVSFLIAGGTGVRASIDYRLAAYFGALCLFLSTIEYVVPKPLPFMRLGFANLPILAGLAIFPPSGVLFIVLLKVLGQGLVYGSLFSYVFVFSAAGSFASALAMLPVHRLLGRRVSLVGVGVTGALCSNLVQIVLARYFILGEGAWLIGPPFLAVGLIASLALGLFAETFVSRSAWYSRLLESRTIAAPAGESGIARDAARAPAFSRERLLLAAGLAALPAFLLQPSLTLRIFLCGFYILLNVLLRSRVRLWPNLAAAAGIVLTNLLSPRGLVLFRVGFFPVTQEAALDGLFKAVTLIGLVYLSRLTVRPGLRLPGGLGAAFASMLLSFERLTSAPRGALGRRGLWLWLDETLDRGMRAAPDPADPAAEPGSAPTGARASREADRGPVLALAVGLHWLLLSAGLVFTIP